MTLVNLSREISTEASMQNPSTSRRRDHASADLAPRGFIDMASTEIEFAKLGAAGTPSSFIATIDGDRKHRIRPGSRAVPRSF
jgi:hypothetical protein